MSAKRDVGSYFEDILESIGRIEKSIKNVSRAEFNRDVDKQDATVHRIEIIGEAAKRVPQEIRDRFPQIPWRDVSRTRDKIIHHYDQIDLDEIWDIIKIDLLPLKKQVKEALRDWDKKS